MEGIERLERLVMDVNGAAGIGIVTVWDGRLILSAKETRELCERLPKMFPEYFDLASDNDE